MSLSIIENQVIAFEPSTVNQDCLCNGRTFIRKVNKNDITEVEFISTPINSEPEFDNQGAWLFVAGPGALDPFPTVPSFNGNDTFGVCDGSINASDFTNPYLAVNQIEFSFDNGLTWYNESSPASGDYFGGGLLLNVCAGTYECILKDTVYFLEYRQTVIIN